MILKFLKLSRAYLSKSDKHRFTDYNKTANIQAVNILA